MCCTNPDSVQCFGIIFPNVKFVFASICAARPVPMQSDQYRSCWTVKRHRWWVLLGSSRWGATKTALWLRVREMTWYLYTRGVRGQIKAKKNADLKLLCHERFHHVRHHVHDGHCIGEFATVIWRLYLFTVYSVVTTAENPASENSPQSIEELCNGHVVNLKKLSCQPGSINGLL